ncbi:MAG: class I SAM-dependent methyltransferase [Flavobacteriales bacterium]|jgi:SAM-dependent methyltransferase|nr:class I SAM-dependent methyltransferase [Flavobacteriales bacterium]
MSMTDAEVARMDELEGSLWWYRGLRALITWALNSHAPKAVDILDAGCGTGGMLKAIGDARRGARLHGIDLSEASCAFTRRKTGAQVVQGSIDALPFAEASCDALVSLDVLGYPMDREAALRGFHRVLRPGGILVLNLAAYQWMLSYHDVAVGQVKRFNRSEASAMLREAGFEVLRTTYWNTLLFPLMALRRKLWPSPEASDVAPFHPIVDKAFGGCLALERRLISFGAALPFGGSVLLVARRPHP